MISHNHPVIECTGTRYGVNTSVPVRHLKHAPQKVTCLDGKHFSAFLKVYVSEAKQVLVCLFTGAERDVPELDRAPRFARVGIHFHCTRDSKSLLCKSIAYTRSIVRLSSWKLCIVCVLFVWGGPVALITACESGYK